MNDITDQLQEYANNVRRAKMVLGTDDTATAVMFLLSYELNKRGDQQLDAWGILEHQFS